MARASRRKIASEVAELLLAGKKDAVKQLAAYLVHTGRERELDLVVRDVEAALADRGILLADVASSRKLSSEAAREIRVYLKQKTGAATIQLRETVDPQLLGGVRVSIPGSELDGTLRHTLNQLKASKV